MPEPAVQQASFQNTVHAIPYPSMPAVEPHNKQLVLAAIAGSKYRQPCQSLKQA